MKRIVPSLKGNPMATSRGAHWRSLGLCASLLLLVGCGGDAADSAGPTSARGNVFLHGVELVQNGSFTGGLEGWDTWLQDGGDAVFAAREGRAVVRVKTVPTTPWGIQLLTRRLPLRAGTTYRFTFRARADVPATVDALVREHDADVNGDGFPWSPYTYGSYSVGTEWSRYTADFTMSLDDGDAGICFFVGQATSKVLLDDVSLVEVIPPPPGTELVDNGDFAERLRGWQTWLQDGGGATFGVTKGAANVTVTTAATTPYGIQLHRGELPLFAGRRYRFSFTAWADAPGTIDALVEENGHDVDGDGFPWTSYTYGSYTLETAPQRYSTEFTVPLTNVDAGVYFFLGQASGKVRVDDVSVVELLPPGGWVRPPQPAAPSTEGLSHVEDPEHHATWFFADGVLLALYNNLGNTFPEFWVDGVNIIGGYDPVGSATNWGPPVKGHRAGYPYGQFDAVGFAYGEWQGFWSGYNYIDQRWNTWAGVNGNPGAARSFTVQPTADGRLDVHVVTEVAGPDGQPLYGCDVHYYVSRSGIGVRNDVTVLSDLEPWGYGDSGAQFMMTQADSDIDPDLPLDREQPDQYFQLALDGFVQDLDPYPPYGQYTPSVEYADLEWISPPYFQMHELPGGALVPADAPKSYLSVMGRKSRAINVAMRVDQARSTLPQLEYYCEINGFRDYLNFVYSAALGWNGPAVVPTGTQWRLYGDLLPWTGTDPEALRSIPMLSDGIP